MPKITQYGGASNLDALPGAAEPLVPEVLKGLVKEPEFPSDYADWGYTDLLAELKSRGLSRGGKTEELVERLREDDEK